MTAYVPPIPILVFTLQTTNLTPLCNMQSLTSSMIFHGCLKRTNAFVPYFAAVDSPPRICLFSGLSRNWIGFSYFNFRFSYFHFPNSSVPRDQDFLYLQWYAFAVFHFPPTLPCAPASIRHYGNTCTCVFHFAGIRARDRIFPHRAFCAQAPTNALFTLRQTSRPGIHSATSFHDFCIRSCLFLKRLCPDYE